MRYPVKWYNETMQGAPEWASKTTGSLYQLWKTLLFDGFNLQSVTGATYDSGTGEVTLTFATTHGFQRHQIVSVSGADQAEYNGEQRVTRLTENTISYVPETVPQVSPATGTIACKVAPVGGWETLYDDPVAFKMAIRSTDVDATSHVLIMDNSAGATTYSLYADMSVVDNWVDIATHDLVVSRKVPAGWIYGTEEWGFIADIQMIYWFSRVRTGAKYSCCAYGNINTIRPGDAHHYVFHNPSETSTDFRNSAPSGITAMGANGTTAQRTIARAYHQHAGPVAYSNEGVNAGALAVQFDFPNPADNGFYCAVGQRMVKESGSLRGFMPGQVEPLNGSSNSQLHRVIFDNLPGLSGAPVIFMLCHDSDQTNNGTPRLLGFRLDQWREQVG